MATKQGVSSAQWKHAFPVLPSLVKLQVCRGNIYSSDQNTNYSTMNKIWVTQQAYSHIIEGKGQTIPHPITCMGGLF